MNKRRRYRAVLVLGTVGLLLTVACGLWLRSARRQEALNRQLIAALANEDDQQALVLVEKGANPSTPYEYLPTPILQQLWASLLHHSSLPSNYGPSAFEITCGAMWSHSPPELVKAMIQHGANVNMEDFEKWTPVDFAVLYDHPKTVGVLLDHRANVNARTVFDETPLTVGLDADASATIIRMLLGYGADPNISDNGGTTVLQRAQQKHRLTLAYDSPFARHEEGDKTMPALIRLALPEDAPALASIYAPFCTATSVSFETVAPAADEMAQRIRKITERLPWLVLEEEGQIAGYVYASQHRERAAYQWSVDVTVYVGTDYRRRGVGRALYTTLFHILVKQGYFHAYAGITLPNAASVGLHESLGFEPVGIYRGVGYKLGDWHDVAWYTLALQPQRADPNLPRSVREVLTTSDWIEAIARGQALWSR